MNNIELKVTREALNLSSASLSKMINISDRHMRRIEAGKSAVPDDLTATLDALNKRVESMVNQTVEFVNTIKDKPDIIVLIAYHSIEDMHLYQPDVAEALHAPEIHRAALWRIKSALPDIDVRIIGMNKEHYEAWLNGRSDSEQLRSEWSQLQI